ncbi:MAG: hypothetical protein AAB368_13995, partial [bacterium]
VKVPPTKDLGSYTFTITGQAGPVCVAATVSNTAWISVSDGCSTSVLTTNHTDLTVAPPPMALNLTKTRVLPAGPVANPGEPFLYRIVVTNTGAATLTSLVVSDTIPPTCSAYLLVTQADGPAGFTAAPLAYGPSGTVYAWDAAALVMSPGTSYTFTIAGTVREPCMTIPASNTAYVAGGTACGATELAATTGFTIGAPVFAVAGSAAQSPAAPIPGAAVTYRITVENTGTATLSSLAVTETISPLLVDVVSDGPAAYGFGSPAVTSLAPSGTRYVWSGTGVPPGAVLTFTITGLVSATCAPVTVSNTPLVDAAWGCTATAFAAASLDFTTTPAGVAYTVARIQTPASRSLVPGPPVTYAIVVANTGSATLTAVTVTDTVAPQLVDQTADQPFDFSAPVVSDVPLTGTRYAWSGTGLAFGPGRTYTFTITGRVGAVCPQADVTATAFVTVASTCAASATPSNATSFTALPVTAGLAVALQQLPAGPGIGETVQYRIVVTNGGTATLDTLTVTDTVSPLILNGDSSVAPIAFGALVMASIPGTGTRYEWVAAGLGMAPGTTFTFTITGRVGAVCSAT